MRHGAADAMGQAMAHVVTLTLNPAIDGSARVDCVRPTVKLRTHGQRFDAGGGGINVARVIARMGGDVEALYLAGGITGPILEGLVARTGIAHRALAIAGDTRIAQVVHEEATGAEYRFTPEGPEVSAAEADLLLATLAQTSCDWLVLSGSLPRGLEPDFLARIVAMVRSRGRRVVLDTSGPALAATLAAGGLTLVKPNREELEQLAGRALPRIEDVHAAAHALVDSGGAALVAVTLGADGALLAGVGVDMLLPAPAVPRASSVGAGDSFLAGMVFALASGMPEADALRLGIAAGAAAVMTPGTDLAHADDIRRLAAAQGVVLPE
ncbi:1-phosphofructokinase family hexose kinase [Sandarakinorhabdus rubra]|uniref:1-phosphofructokinase family hexose kinase n=1 Tax=Sandarakinorhabdus rubra TaxID=2672568 RepID=UPI001F4480BA|nr:1-phosphofructokinase family hexose kinase [Sandarakinorhabdus rubra]